MGRGQPGPIDWDSGTENLDWTAKVLRKIITFTQDGGEINLLVPGICVGAQAYWNAEATMMMHTESAGHDRPRDDGAHRWRHSISLVCICEDDLALGGYTAIMGPNGQAQAHAVDLDDAYHLLYQYHNLTYVPPGAYDLRTNTSDPNNRDMTLTPYPSDFGHGFETIGELFSMEHNQP